MVFLLVTGKEARNQKARQSTHALDMRRCTAIGEPLLARRAARTVSPAAGEKRAQRELGPKDSRAAAPPTPRAPARAPGGGAD